MKAKKLEKDIPLPENKGHWGNTIGKHLEQLEVGDSMLFEKEESESVELDEEELVTFLNEYFLLNPEKLPEATIF